MDRIKNVNPVKSVHAGNFFALVDRETVLLALIAALVAASLLYRLDLAWIIYTGSSKLASLQPAQVPVTAFLKTLLNDLIPSILTGLCYLAFKEWLRFRLPRLVGWKGFRPVETILALGALLLITLILRVHFQLLVNLETGLTATFVQCSPSMFSSRDFFSMLTASDGIFFMVPSAAFFLSLKFAGWLRRIYKPAGLALIVLVLAVQILPGKQKLSDEISVNPAVYLLDDFMRPVMYPFHPGHVYYDGLFEQPSEAQTNSIRLVDAVFVHTNETPGLPPRRRVPAPDGKPWNVLIFVLESTGADYVFDDYGGSEPPMPFLEKMAGEGLYLSNHFSTANISARAAFSIFTGIYSCPSHRILSMEKDEVIPTLNRYLGPGYDYFFVHPTSPSYWFPQFLFLNNGLKEFDSKDNLPPGLRPDLTELAHNELNSFDFLRSRLDRSREPFLAVYWSFVPHYPYSDYGPDFRIRPELLDRDRYYNNLRVLDDQLRLTYEHLVKTGMADRTLFVFVGDHGEAFGQHPGIWSHTYGSYSEMYRVPAVFWQPGLVRPRRIAFPTSHVDIVPTLLDLIGHPFDPARFQGDSVLRGTPARKYIFMMDGYADNLSAVSRGMKKVSISFNQDDATAFNLAKDPGEKFPLNEVGYADEINAILEFRNFQLQMVPDYNNALLAGHGYPPNNQSALRPAEGQGGADVKKSAR
jgi:hypothetical protein